MRAPQARGERGSKKEEMSGARGLAHYQEEGGRPHRSISAGAENPAGGGYSFLPMGVKTPETR